MINQKLVLQLLLLIVLLLYSLSTRAQKVIPVIVEDTIHLDVIGVPLIYINSVDSSILIETVNPDENEKLILFELQEQLKNSELDLRIYKRDDYYSIREFETRDTKRYVLEVKCKTMDSFKKVVERSLNLESFITRVELKYIQNNIYDDRKVMRKINDLSDKEISKIVKSRNCFLGRKIGFSEQKVKFEEYLTLRKQRIDNYGWLQVKEGSMKRVLKMTALVEYRVNCE